MFDGGHWQYFQLKEAMPPDQFAKWEASELPGPTADQRSTGTGGWTVAAFSKDPAKVEVCATLMREVYMGPANEVVGDLPTRADRSSTICRSSRDPTSPSSSEYLVHGQARPGVPIYPEISNQIQIMMGEVLSGAKEPEQALDDAWKRVNDAYARLSRGLAGAAGPGAAPGDRHDAGMPADGAARRAGRRRRAPWRLAERPLVWLLPLAVLLCVSYVYPAVDVVRFSFTDATLLNPEYELHLRELSQRHCQPRPAAASSGSPSSSWSPASSCSSSWACSSPWRSIAACKRGLPGVSFIRIVILASWIVPGVGAASSGS